MNKLNLFPAVALMVLLVLSVTAAYAVQSYEGQPGGPVVLRPSGETATMALQAERVYHVERIAIGIIGVAVLTMILAWAYKRYHRSLSGEDAYRSRQTRDDMGSTPLGGGV